MRDVRLPDSDKKLGETHARELTERLAYLERGIGEAPPTESSGRAEQRRELRLGRLLEGFDVEQQDPLSCALDRSVDRELERDGLAVGADSRVGRVVAAPVAIEER